MNWDNQLSSILSGTEGSLAKIKVSRKASQLIQSLLRFSQRPQFIHVLFDLSSLTPTVDGSIAP